MRSEEEVKQLVQKNIKQISIGEFAADGGWPNIDAIDVAIFSQKVIDELETLNIQILYTIDRPGCCFIPGMEEQKRLSKTLTITNEQVAFI